MNEQERVAVALLQELADLWPSSLLLFSWSGSLVVIRRATGEVVANIHDGLLNDGGDPECVIDGDTEYLLR